MYADPEASADGQPDSTDQHEHINRCCQRPKYLSGRAGAACHQAHLLSRETAYSACLRDVTHIRIDQWVGSQPEEARKRLAFRKRQKQAGCRLPVPADMTLEQQGVRRPLVHPHCPQGTGQVTKHQVKSDQRIRRYSPGAPGVHARAALRRGTILPGCKELPQHVSVPSQKRAVMA